MRREILDATQAITRIYRDNTTGMPQILNSESDGCTNITIVTPKRMSPCIRISEDLVAEPMGFSESFNLADRSDTKRFTYWVMDQLLEGWK